MQELLRTISLTDYNTRVVVLGVAALGLACGWVGTFMLLRKRALMGDALSHATFPGICVAFMLFQLIADGGGKSLPVLLSGAVVSGVLGVLCVMWIRNQTRIKEDAAMGIVLSVFFGLGTALRGIIQKMPGSNSAGLDGFIYGKTASMTSFDAWLIGVIAMISCGVLLLMYKELKLLCFDESFAKGVGFSTTRLDIVLMGLVTLVTVVGLQAVGLILVIALLIIPSASARFWTDRLGVMVLIAGLIGATSAVGGALISAVVPNTPSGATIVLTSFGCFLLSLIFGIRRGLMIRQRTLRKAQQEILLRAKL
ncbi:MAG: hypothetical protein KatS3mg104_2126 [Phycisphaerae bacterium]|jgi:manganese/zinc/iron transport system permease protein|nr:MAG: hypothetical protein KatS3mg104_2126 [Phycisphaerae bacterium]